MITQMKKLFLFIITFVGVLNVSVAQKSDKQASTVNSTNATDSVLMTIGGKPIYLSEFLYVYKKNNKDQTNNQKGMEDYLDLFTTFKMKVMEAEELRKDTIATFQNELMGYRRQVAQQYLTDKRVNDSLFQEAYDRMHYDVRASHILIRLEENALPKDTLLAWNRIQILQNMLNGKPVTKLITDYDNLLRKTKTNAAKSDPADTLNFFKLIDPLRQLDLQYEGKPVPFDELARKASDDPSAAQNGGDLGYFTSFSMVYPFETAAYSAPVGKVTPPVRTRFGYHLIKVVDRRPAQGEVLVAHIMVKAAQDMSPTDSVSAKQKIDEIYAKLKAGEDFATLVKQFSDDKPSVAKNGELPWFGLYKMPPPFEKAAFALSNNGDYSEPVKTAWGWHIIKRLDRRTVPAYDAVKNEIKNKVNRDQRGTQGKTALVAKVKREYGFTENLPAKNEFYSVLDSSYISGRWEASKAARLNKTLFTIGTKTYTQADFASWLEDHQVRRGAGPTDLKLIVDKGYKQMVEESCVAYEDSHLESKYPDFKNLMQEYRDGILLFDLQDEKVWSKAVKDTTGLQGFYDANKNNYLWPERVDATIYSCSDAQTASIVRKMIKKGKSEKEILELLNKDSQLMVQTETKLYQKGENTMVDQNWKEGISADMSKDGRVVFVVTRKVMQPTPKSLQEARGAITNDYQTSLEKQWIENLRKKYPANINREVLQNAQ
jgi:peptidyl-prolyl cis-trans isomerase SurA